MKIAIVFASATGTTAKAAEAMGEAFKHSGHQPQVLSVSQAVPAEVSAADLICIGSWVKGLFIIRQHPTKETLRFIDGLGELKGKQALVFCTYKLAVGSTLNKMAEPLEAKGAEVVGKFKYRGPEPDEAFQAFARLLQIQQ